MFASWQGMVNTAHHNDALVLGKMTPLLAYRTDRHANNSRRFASCIHVAALGSLNGQKAGNIEFSGFDLIHSPFVSWFLPAPRAESPS